MKFKIMNLVLALALMMAVGSAFSGGNKTPPGHEEGGNGQGHENHQGKGNGHENHQGKGNGHKKHDVSPS